MITAIIHHSCVIPKNNSWLGRRNSVISSSEKNYSEVKQLHNLMQLVSDIFWILTFIFHFFSLYLIKMQQGMLLTTATYFLVGLVNEKNDYFWMKNAMETYTELYRCWIANIMYLAFIYLQECIPFTHTKSNNLLISLGMFTSFNWKLLSRQVLISHSCSCFCAAQLLHS